MTVALSFFSKVLKKYFNEIMEIKKTKLMTKCDLSREERIRKYEKMLTQYDALFVSKMYNHLKKKYLTEFKLLIQNLETQIEMIKLVGQK